jgi:hypothetical protein
MSQESNSRRINKNESFIKRDIHLVPRKENILIIVKTYPAIPNKHNETVCTAGITNKGELIRVYPVEYRYLPTFRQYKKYQWINAEITKQDKNKDARKESYKIDANSIKLIGKPIDTKNKWELRKKIVLPLASKSLEEIQDNYHKDFTSLGIFKPKQILDFIVEPDTSDWKPKQQAKLDQFKLLGEQPKLLEKIPFKFSYKFKCDDSRCKGHTISIHDWEIYELYMSIKYKYHYAMDIILEKIKQKYFGEMCRTDKDTYLIVGTVNHTKSFIIIGVFWPPKE